MYELVKLFNKVALQPDEVIQRFFHKADGTVFAVETDKAVYELKLVGVSG